MFDLMREHAIQNGVLEIHMPRLPAGLDGINWSETKAMLLEVFRNQAVRISVNTPTVPMPVQRRDETVECAQADSASNSSEATLPYYLAERLAGHDLLSTAETQSLFANAGSMRALPEEERVEEAHPEKILLSEPDRQLV